MEAINPFVEFKEESEYAKGEGSIPDIVLRHIRKISDICCKEFTGGYWQKKPVKVGGGVVFIEKYNEDTREAYCNAVDFLVDIVAPIGMKKDSEFKRYIEELEGDGKSGVIKEQLIDVEEKLRIHRKTFKAINKMFERTNFFQNKDSGDE